MREKVDGRVRGILYLQKPINNNEGIVSRAGHHAAFARRAKARPTYFFPKTTPLAPLRRGTSPRTLVEPTDAPKVWSSFQTPIGRPSF